MTVVERPAVTVHVDLENAYFFLRTALWTQTELQEWLDLRENRAYDVGYGDGMDYVKQQGSDQWENEYMRGHDAGFEEGFDQGHNQGYKDGYQDGAAEASYDVRNYR